MDGGREEGDGEIVLSEVCMCGRQAPPPHAGGQPTSLGPRLMALMGWRTAILKYHIDFLKRQNIMVVVYVFDMCVADDLSIRALAYVHRNAGAGRTCVINGCSAEPCRTCIIIGCLGKACLLYT